LTLLSTNDSIFGVKFTLSLLVILIGTLDASTGGEVETALTIHSENFAVVRDKIQLDIPAGGSKFSYDGATSSLEPTSVILLAEGEGDLSIREQSYRNDVLNTSYLLSLFEGKEINFVREIEDGGAVVLKGTVVRSGHGSGEPIIQIEGSMRFGLPGTPLFPDLGDDTLLKPRLEWTIDSLSGYKGEGTVSYLSGGMGWKGSYNLVMSEDGRDSSLRGWVSLNNSTGRNFDDTEIKLLAGEVRRNVEELAVMPRAAVLYEEGVVGGVGGVTRKSLDEYHVYSLPGTYRIRDKETKQVEFLTADEVDVTTLYRLSIPTGGGVDSSEGVKGSIEVVRSFDNSKQNGLGSPMPAGELRVYRLDGDQPEFLGESTIGHTPENENIEIVTGNAFDITANKVRLERDESGVHYLGGRVIRESYAIAINNRKKSDVVIQVSEMIAGPDWKIIESNFPHKKTAALEAQWDIPLKAEETVSLNYTAEYRIR
jgi:hypothetical protein